MTNYNNLISDNNYTLLPTIQEARTQKATQNTRIEYVTINQKEYRVAAYVGGNFQWNCQNISRLASVILLIVCIVPMLFSSFWNYVENLPITYSEVTHLFLVDRPLVPLPNLLKEQLPEYLNGLVLKEGEITPQDIEGCLKEAGNDFSFREGRQIVNTYLTEVLALYGFGEAVDTEALFIINKFLSSLMDCVVKGDINALELLKRSNNHLEKIGVDKSGFPQNNPLLLLIKGMNTRGVQTILPAYNGADLLFTTPYGNTALHIAVITGQLDLAYLIMLRAEQCGVFDELINKPNNMGKTADDMFALLKDKNITFKRLDHIHDEYFGGEEMRKALVSLPVNGVFLPNRLRAFSVFNGLSEIPYSILNFYQKMRVIRSQ